MNGADEGKRKMDVDEDEDEDVAGIAGWMLVLL
jgi:hypothetical protein